MKIELFEHESRRFDKIVCDRLAHGIESLNRSAGTKILDLHREEIFATSFVGIIQIRDVVIQVHPKLYKGKEQNQKESAKNLLHLLQYTRRLFKNIKETDLSSLLNRKTDFFEVLIHLYASHLFELLKREVHRSYMVVETESRFLKGSWKLSEQLVAQPHTRHRFFVKYDEFTEDNKLNQILKFTSRRLQKLSRDVQNKRMLSGIIFALAEVEDARRITPEDLDQIHFTRLNDLYKPIFELAKLFINNLSLQFSPADNETFSFVFDMNLLFEEFVSEFIRKERVLEQTAYIGCAIKAQSGSRWLATCNERKVFQLVPDILICDGNRSRCIIDTKYKLLNPTKNNYGISQSDMYQMFAYAHKYECDRIILLYPQHNSFSKSDEQTYWIDGKKRIEVRTIDIRRDISLPAEKRELINEFRELFNPIIEEISNDSKGSVYGNP